MHAQYAAGSGIEVSWAGGVNGREVIDVFLPYIEVRNPQSDLCLFLIFAR